MNRTKAIVTLTATLISTVALSTSAYAGDRKVYPGSTCDAPDQARSAILLKTSAGTVRNTSASTTINWVICPIVRDTTEGATTGPRAIIRVRNTKNVTTQCWLEVINSDGSYQAITDKSFTGVGEGLLDLQIASTSTAIPYQIECSLPGGSSIVRYSVDE